MWKEGSYNLDHDAGRWSCETATLISTEKISLAREYIVRETNPSLIPGQKTNLTLLFVFTNRTLTLFSQEKCYHPLLFVGLTLILIIEGFTLQLYCGNAMAHTKTPNNSDLWAKVTKLSRFIT